MRGPIRSIDRTGRLDEIPLFQIDRFGAGDSNVGLTHRLPHCFRNTELKNKSSNREGNNADVQMGTIGDRVLDDMLNLQNWLDVAQEGLGAEQRWELLLVVEWLRLFNGYRKLRYQVIAVLTPQITTAETTDANICTTVHQMLAEHGSQSRHCWPTSKISRHPMNINDAHHPLYSMHDLTEHFRTDSQQITLQFLGTRNSPCKLDKKVLSKTFIYRRGTIGTRTELVAITNRKQEPFLCVRLV